MPGSGFQSRCVGSESGSETVSELGSERSSGPGARSECGSTLGSEPGPEVCSELRILGLNSSRFRFWGLNYPPTSVSKSVSSLVPGSELAPSFVPILGPNLAPYSVRARFRTRSPIPNSVLCLDPRFRIPKSVSALVLNPFLSSVPNPFLSSVQSALPNPGQVPNVGPHSVPSAVLKLAPNSESGSEFVSTSVLGSELHSELCF